MGVRNWPCFSLSSWQVHLGTRLVPYTNHHQCLLAINEFEDHDRSMQTQGLLQRPEKTWITRKISSLLYWRKENTVPAMQVSNDGSMAREYNQEVALVGPLNNMCHYLNPHKPPPQGQWKLIHWNSWTEGGRSKMAWEPIGSPTSQHYHLIYMMIMIINTDACKMIRNGLWLHWLAKGISSTFGFWMELFGM